MFIAKIVTKCQISCTVANKRIYRTPDCGQHVCTAISLEDITDILIESYSFGIYSEYHNHL